MNLQKTLSPLIAPQQLVALLLASLVPMGMLMVRSVMVGGIWYWFMAWNLFLAWMPAFFTILAHYYQHKKTWLLLFATLWLLFFPNAPYMVTDLIHLRQLGTVPIWYDALMLFAFALVGLLLAFASLGWMHKLVADYWGTWVGWGFVVVSLNAGSFGVFIGRFLRWNSWDAFLNPISLLQNILQTLQDPYWGWHIIGASFLLNTLMLLSYFVFHPPTTMQLDKQS